MAPITTTRTLFELRVGSFHTIEVLLQIRLSDISWWNSDLYNHERELYKLLGRRVLPVECREEIEEDCRKRAKRQDNMANNEKKKEGEVVIGEANLKKRAAAEKAKSTDTKKRGGKKGKKETKSSKKQKVSDKNSNAKNDNTESKEKKLPKLLREPGTWIMGSSIQICYVMEEMERNTATTLIFRQRESTADSEKSNTPTMSQSSAESKQTKSSDKVDDNDKLVPLATFRSWKKLPKRVNLWVFKFDPNDPTELSVSEGGGFPRPDLLPMADIFRSSGGDEDE